MKKLLSMIQSLKALIFPIRFENFQTIIIIIIAIINNLSPVDANLTITTCLQAHLLARGVKFFAMIQNYCP